MSDEIKFIQNKDGKFELYEPYATVDFMTEEDYTFMKNAIQKQIPQKPIGKHTDYKCSICGRRVRSGKGSSSRGQDSFCQRCGQKLDWSDENDRI